MTDVREGDDFTVIDERFGARFLEARRTRGLSQEAIVDRMGRRGYTLHVTAIGKIERGERRVTVGEATALAASIGVGIDILIGRSKMQDAYIRLATASGHLAEALFDYERALVGLVKAADEADGADTALYDDLLNLTPTQASRTSNRALQRALAGEKGRYARRLMDTVEADDVALSDAPKAHDG